MDIKPSFGQGVREMAKDPNKHAERPMGQKVSEEAQAKKNEGENEQISMAREAKLKMNKSIMESAMRVNLGTTAKSQKLLFQSVIDGINKELEAVLGPNALETAMDQGIDVSPEATAKRIVDMSTAFFDIYKEQNPDMSEAEAREKFGEIISGGIDTGFAEAREILDGLGVLEGDISENIDKTYDIVQDLLAEFINGSQASPEAETVTEE